MKTETTTPSPPTPQPASLDPDAINTVCPVCGEKLFHEKCKVVCKSSRCVYRIIFNCAEF